MRAATLIALALATPAAPARSQECRLALVLAIDVSSSIDAVEDRLQRNGLAAALIAPEVQRAALSAPQPVAIAVYEWSGRYNQTVLADWRLINCPADLLVIADSIAGSQRSEDAFPTAMGYALGFGANMLRRAPDCLYRTLDMAGDGENNEGFRPAQAYAAFPFGGVTVNGLVVAEPAPERRGALLNFYRSEVLRGPGAFLEEARGFEDYQRAMRRKLERELGVRAIGALDRDAALPG
jgi:uncharacterized protein DUF1194